VVTDGSFSDAKMDSLVYYLRKIVYAETDFFHDTPYKHYTFEIVAPTFSHLPSIAQGALEHANSSDYLLADFGWSMFKSNFLSIFSHEFFHLWNVKRIHSNLLGPFDYTKRVMTTSLWMAEGITEYYAHTLLARYGIESPERFYADIRQWQGEMAMSPPANGTKSLEQLSIDESDFNLDEATLFYTRGPLVALMLDIEIRERTNNKHSLDDVMRALDKDAQHGKTFREADLIKKVEEYAGCDVTDFYDKYIHGTDSLPMDSYFAKMGILSASEEGTHPKSASTSLSPYHDSLYIVNTLDTASSLAAAGVKNGDILSHINGEKISQNNLMDLFLGQDTLRVQLERANQTIELKVKPSAKETSRNDSTQKPKSHIDPNAPPLAVAIRKGIVGS
jgi:predicted metalloprotease with PDZ domain